MEIRRLHLSMGMVVAMAAMLAGCSGAPLATMTSPSAAEVAEGSFNASNGGGSSPLSVTCETRGTRSRISVNGRSLSAGSYTAQVASGANAAASGPRAAVRGEVQFDFDSNAADIAAGATAISRTFIQGGSVAAKIVNGAGAVVLSGSGSCRVR